MDSPESCPGWHLLSLSLGFAVPSLSMWSFKGDEPQSRREKAGVTDFYPKPSEIHFSAPDQGHKHTSATTGVGYRCETHIWDFKVWVSNPKFPILPHTQTKKIQLPSTKPPRRGCCTCGPIENTRALQRSPLVLREQWHFSPPPSASSTLLIPAIFIFVCTRSACVAAIAGEALEDS